MNHETTPDGTVCAGTLPPRAQGERLLLPLSAADAGFCQAAMAALDGPGPRAEAPRTAALPEPFLQVLRLLDDPEVERAAADLRGLAGQTDALCARRRARRRALFQDLGRRHPDALAALLGAFGAPRGPGAKDSFIVVNVYTWLIIITIGIDGRSEHPFADLDPAECCGPAPALR